MELKSVISRGVAAACALVCFATAGNLQAQSNAFLVSPASINFSYQFGAANQPQFQDITVLASQTNVSFTAVLTTSGGGNWLNGGATVPTTPGSVRLFVVTTGLAPAVYTGQVAISAPGLATVNVPVNFKVTNTSEISGNPSALSFTALAGSIPQSKLLTVSSSGSPLGYAAVANTTSGGSWLSVSPSSGTTENAGTGTLVVTVTPAGLAAGNYAGTITLSSAGASNSPVSIPVTLAVTTAPQVTATPSALAFNFQTSGATPAAQSITLSSTASEIPFSVSIDTGAVLGWLSVNPISGTTPASLSVTVNPAGLSPNTYTGHITILGGPNPVVVNVTLTVSNSPLLNFQPTSLTFTSQAGTRVPNQTLNLSTTGTTLPFSITPSVTTPAGGGWLFATPLNGSASGSPTGVLVAVNPGGLPAGTYNGTLTVVSVGAGNPSQIVNVTLVVTAAVALNLSTNSLTFTAQSGGLPPALQTFNIGSSDGSPVPFIITTSTTDGGHWLSPNISSGVTPAQGVGVLVNQAGLAPGNYTGTITVTASGIASASTQSLTVNLTVTGQAFTVVPASLAFTQNAGGAAPPNQTIQVASPTAGVSLAASASSNGNWLTVSQATPITPTTLTVGVNGSALSPGTYAGTITVVGGSGQTIINVTLTISNSPPLNATPSSLVFNYQTGGSTPAAQGVVVITSGTVANFSASATTTSGGAWLAVTPQLSTTPSSLSVTVNPVGLTVGTYNGTISLTPTGAGAGSAVNLNVSLVITAPAPPSLTAFVNGASFSPGPAAPGTIVTLFGTGLGPVNVVSLKLTNGKVDTTLSDTQVLFDGFAAPIIYTSATQVAVIAPYNLYGRLSTSIQVQYQGVRSNVLVQRVDNSMPGIFAANSTGRGPGAILNQDNSLNTANNPATKGQAIVLFATGEGQTNAEGIDGKIIGTDLRKSVLPVSVKVGGIDCRVEYQGSAPGLVSGVFQVNVRLPDSVPSGAAVPVSLQVGNAVSQDGITVAIR